MVFAYSCLGYTPFTLSRRMNPYGPLTMPSFGKQPFVAAPVVV